MIFIQIDYLLNTHLDSLNNTEYQLLVINIWRLNYAYGTNF